MISEPRLMPPLDQLMDAPERAMELTPAEAAVVLAKAEGLAAVARARLVAVAQVRNTERPDPEHDMLTVDEAAARLGLTREQFYRRAHRWSWVVKLGRRTMRVRAAGLDRYLAGKKA